MNPTTEVEMTYPDGRTFTVRPIQMLVHTQNAEFKAKHGMFLPSVGKLHPTVRQLRDHYGIPAKTWADAAEQMRDLYTGLQEAIASQR